MKQQLNDTIVALSTPPGEGALGVIRISGPEAIAIANAMFRGKDLREQPGYSVHYGKLYSSEGELLDEVVVTLFRAPHSYTGQDVVEISCHGSPYILTEVLQTAIAHGARAAEPGEFTMRAFLNGKMDLTQAEAVADLIAARSRGAHDLAMRQLRGGIADEMRHLRRQLIRIAGLIELELDFGEEDVEFADRNQLRNLLDEVETGITSLLDSFKLGNAIKRGVPVVIAGRPNAGKSTLLNALLREDRAIVSEIPGTTRDTIQEVVNIRGIAFRFIDTAGIRQAQDRIEAIGIQRTLDEVEKAAIVLYIFDAQATAPGEVTRDLEQLAARNPAMLVIANKTDLSAPPPAHWPYPTIGISAKTGHNLDELRHTLYRHFAGPQAGTDTPILSNARHAGALRKALENLRDARTALESGLSGDLIALDIRKIIHHLGEVTGEITTDDLLDMIFREFCIGK